MGKIKKWNFLVGILISLCSISFTQGQIPFSCEGQFFLTLTDTGTSALFEVRIDPFTGNVTFQPIDSNLGIQINAIGYRSTDNFIYGMDPDDFRLYRLDATGAVTLLKVLTLNNNYAYFAADITPDGQFMIIIGGQSALANGKDEELVIVDLTMPGYPYTVSQLPVTNTRIFDMAFDPTSGILYGFDSNNSSLVTIDYQTGTIDTNYPSLLNVGNIGSMFFDAFGNLFAYGSVGTGPQNTFFRVDKITGRFTFATTGPQAQGTDACSCPYTIEMTKEVFPETTLPCEDVTYVFSIANSSGFSQSGIDFRDVLPGDLTIVGILKNPYGGNLISGPGTKELNIEDMTIPPGIDSIVIRVNVGHTPFGRYQNQAILMDLPSNLGNTRLSDNPNTLVESDSTSLQVNGLLFDTLYLDDAVCSGETLFLDVSTYGNTFLWDDGSTLPLYPVTESGDYSVTVASGCDTAIVYFDVAEISLFIEIVQGEQTLDLGDSIQIQTLVTNSGNTTLFSWDDPIGGSLSCFDCPNPWSRPFFDVEYTVIAQNEAGCIDSTSLFISVDKTRKVYVPNAFSPNFDGVNDFFFIQGQDFAIIKKLEIFHRWGGVVFSTQDAEINKAQQGWDGTYNGKPLNNGVFVWFAEIEFLDGEVEIYSGDITLIK